MIHMLYIYRILYTHSRRNKAWIHSYRRSQFVPSPVLGSGSPVITSVQPGSGAGETQEGEIYGVSKTYKWWISQSYKSIITPNPMVVNMFWFDSNTLEVSEVSRLLGHLVLTARVLLVFNRRLLGDSFVDLAWLPRHKKTKTQYRIVIGLSPKNVTPT